jgi:benzoyl-CoA reductase/2-hydroxyglutaryl-CoA dehydratase subunit BcrC/BadD/HgdB
MRLQTTFDIHAWYARVRASGRPVAWCSAFAPAEILLAMGIVPVYPENHAAMLGALSETRDPDRPYAKAAIATATARGHAAPRLCSYALADLGTLDGGGDGADPGATSPIGGLPAPDLFYACDSQCAVVGRWGDAVQDHLKTHAGRDLPHYLLKAPPLRGDHHTAAELAAFKAQILAHAKDIRHRLGARVTPLDDTALARVVASSARANADWQRCLELGAAVPAPWTAFDAFTAMAPIVIARGHPDAEDFYARLRAELTARRDAGHAAVPGERLRLLWDAIPIWPRKNWLARFCAERGVAVVASTYTHSWWFTFDPARPLDSLVERYAWNTMNRSGAWVLDWTLGLARDSHATGILAHWNRSCGIWNSYVKRRLPGFAAAGMPVAVLHADMVDPSAFDADAISRQLQTFFTSLAESPPRAGNPPIAAMDPQSAARPPA